MHKQRLPGRRGIVVALIVLALTTSLAGRVFYFTFSAQHSVDAGSVNHNLQNRDNDAAQWVPPNPQFSLLWVREQTAPIAPDGRVSVRFRYDSLYNRPPPSL